MKRPYTGVGRRTTPEIVCHWMAQIAARLEIEGYVLRSGGARRADTGFQLGVKDPHNLEIYLPNDGFNGNKVGLGFIDAPKLKGFEDALAIAKSFHPNWKRVSEQGRILHARNTFQVLGASLNDPSEFVLFWSPPKGNHQVEGGTNTAIQIALEWKIPVLNFHKARSFNQVWEKLSELRMNAK